MKTKYTALIASALMASSILTGCDDDKQLTLDAPQAKLMETITFDVSETLQLAIGQDSTLVYTYGPEDANDTEVVFTSSDPTVATVDPDGTVHALKLGDAVISATSSIGFQVYEAQAAVTVRVIDHVIKAESIVITNTTPITSEDGSIYVTDELQLAAEILPADHTYDLITWGTSDATKATVSADGLVKCVGAGKVTIYAAANDHSGVRGSLELDIKSYIEATSVSIAPIDGPLCITDGSYTLDVTYSPAGATVGSVSWESDDQSVATVHRGVVKLTGFGTCNITATCTNGTSATVQLTVEPGWYKWDASNGWSGWTTKNPREEIRGDKTWHIGFNAVEAGKKWRQDFSYSCSKNNTLDMYLKSYPVLAIRMTKMNGGNSTLDAVEAATGLNAGNPNPKNGIDLGDGTQLLIYNVGSRPNYANLDLASFSIFQVKLADIPFENITAGVNDFYDIYWIRTFKTEDDAKAFANQQVAAGE